MILQDLLRNIVLYNGIFNPYLHSVREYVLTLLHPSYKQVDKLLFTSQGYLPQKIHIMASAPLTGTCTIPILQSLTLDSANLIKRRHNLHSKIGGSSIIRVLMSESVDVSAKTRLETMSLAINFHNPNTATQTIITTGFINEYTQPFFSHETHEKREYLGEFSLPHEAIQFNSFIERR